MKKNYFAPELELLTSVSLQLAAVNDTSKEDGVVWEDEE